MRAILFRKLLNSLGRRAQERIGPQKGGRRAPERPAPARIASIEIQILLNTTARAFGVPGRKVWNLPASEALREYSEFTLSCMREGNADPDRLYEEAFRTGSRVRRITGFRSPQDIEELVFYLYSNIGIAMDGRIPGELTVSSCYFSRFYTPEECLVMSSVDSGIIAGIAGGGRLDFVERLTQGDGCCRAWFKGGQNHE